MPIHLKENPYQGVNAHFNSYVLSLMHGWRTFHNDHIAYLKSEINRSLPNGYYAVSETSLQIQSRYPEAYPDVGIIRTPQAPRPVGMPSVAVLEVPTLEIETFTDDEWMAVEIYRAEVNQLVTRIELLSPTNKHDRRKYLEVRNRLMQFGIHMVEIDYLHELPPMFSFIPDYTLHEVDSYPFQIVVSEAFREGKTRVYGFAVDEPIPTISLPLGGQDRFTLNFNLAYQRWFAEERRAQAELDYEQLPINVDLYSEADQGRIQAVMARIQTQLEGKN